MDAQKKEGKSVINITPQASKEGLKAMLTAEAEKEGRGLRHFCGEILENALNNKKQYDTPLNNTLPRKGDAINIVVSDGVKDSIREWAKEKQTSMGKQCVFILEKWLETKRVEK